MQPLVKPKPISWAGSSGWWGDRDRSRRRRAARNRRLVRPVPRRLKKIVVKKSRLRALKGCMQIVALDLSLAATGWCLSNASETPMVAWGTLTPPGGFKEIKRIDWIARSAVDLVRAADLVVMEDRFGSSDAYAREICGLTYRLDCSVRQGWLAERVAGCRSFQEDGDYMGQRLTREDARAQAARIAASPALAPKTEAGATEFLDPSKRPHDACTSPLAGSTHFSRSAVYRDRQFKQIQTLDDRTHWRIR